MVVEMRSYTLQPGKIASYLKLYEGEGMAIQKRILGRMVGYYSTEIGPLNQVVHMWAYEDLKERAEKRAVLAADPGWQAYVAKMIPMMVTQESKILNPAPFFTPKFAE
jgi:hypothetical protein